MDPLTCLFCSDPIAKNRPFVHGGFTEKDSPLCLRCWTADGEDLDAILGVAAKIRESVKLPEEVILAPTGISAAAASEADKHWWEAPR